MHCFFLPRILTVGFAKSYAKALEQSIVTESLYALFRQRLRW